MVNILIIDDEENLRTLLERVIELDGYAVIQAGNIKDAIRLLNRENVQVVVPDVRLPEEN